MYLAIAQQNSGIGPSYIGHSSPTKKGIGRTSDEWGPNLTSMFAEGIRSGQPEVERAVQSLYSAPGSFPAALQAGTRAAQAVAQSAPAGGSQGPREIHVHIHLDSREIAQYVAPATADVVVKTVMNRGPVKTVGKKRVA